MDRQMTDQAQEIAHEFCVGQYVLRCVTNGTAHTSTCDALAARIREYGASCSIAQAEVMIVAKDAEIAQLRDALYSYRAKHREILEDIDRLLAARGEGK